MTYPCLLCGSHLAYNQTETGILFFCNECGYKDKGPLGYSVDKSYEYLKENREKLKLRNQNKKSRNEDIDLSSGSTQGFPTRRRKKRKSTRYVQEQDNQSFVLEDDDKISQNALKVMNKTKSVGLPRGLDKSLHENDQLPVFYQKLNKRPPAKGTSVSESIKISGLRKTLEKRGIKKLYRYQEEVYDEILAGSNVVISAPTGLGKTEAFLLPILHIILTNQPDPRTRDGPQAILMYPTKALAADQMQKIKYYANPVGITISKYDGDTSRQDRRKMFQNPPDIILTNADMIHYHLMGNHMFQALISRVRFLVVDEIHLCVGSYGTNVLWIIRRMRRFNQFLQCIGASATISNAQSFAETMFDAPVKLISVGTARLADMHLSILYPKERSNLSLMATVADNYISDNRKTILFGNGHTAAESLNLMLKRRGINSEIHRAGLSLHHRKRVEDAFKDGTLDALVSTPTLELGIDIGSLDSVVSMLTGLTSFVQRIGRAGRKGQESFATLVLRGDDPISAYYARYPDDYLTDIAPAFVEPDNPYIAKMQLFAMIFDRPIKINEASPYLHFLDEMKSEGKVRIENKSYVISNERQIKSLLSKFSIRGIGQSINIWSKDQKIGERALPLAISELHPGAIYLHGGKVYNVDSYNPKTRIAKLKRSSGASEKTQALRDIQPDILKIHQEDVVSGLHVAYCQLKLTENVSGYVKKDIFTSKVTGQYLLDDPLSYNYDTMGFLLALPRPDNFLSSMDVKEQKNVLMGTYHAIEHVLIESGNSYSGGGATQIGGISMADTGMVFVYDGTQGGSGLSKLLYDSLEQGLSRSLKVMEDCPCNRRDGCPRCTYSYQCGNNNQPLDRLGAIETLKRVAKDTTELIYNFEGIESFVIDPFDEL